MLTNEIHFLVILTFFVVKVLLLLLGYLLVRKARENKIRERIDLYKETYRVPLYDYLTTGNSTRLLRPSGKVRELAIEELLGDYSGVLEGEDERWNLSTYAELYLADTYRDNLTSRRWSKRMNTLFFIEDFQMKGLEQDVQTTILADPKATKEEIVQSLTVLARLKSSDLYYYLDQNSEQLLEFDLRNIFRSLELDQFNLLLDGFNDHTAAFQYAVLDKIGSSGNIDYLSFLESIFRQNSGELKIRALKAIVKLGYVEDITDYLSLSESSFWLERMLLAKLLKTMQDPTAITCLKKLLHDDSWWVRSQAGESLASFPNGNEILTKIIAESQDAYARDMASEWLNKGVMT